ncbi:hypothetical protein ABEB36_002391 [Hypothenemus hampei]|uniref:Nuclear condensin complex subunit 3 C-terminal domain-containing protein n=1 Tax=Hypothenemus hampei TaxID=57062 RepID=A0ABD1F680_HYPHA
MTLTLGKRSHTNGFIDDKDFIFNLLDAAQKNPASHEKNSFLLKKIYKKYDLDRFWEMFAPLLGHIIQIDLKLNSLYVNRLFDFIGKFCAILPEQLTGNNDETLADDPFILKIFDYLIMYSPNVLDSVRYRSCQLLNVILYHLENYAMKEELHNKIHRAWTPRLRDQKALIRKEAIVALFRLQDPKDPNDIIITEFKLLLSDRQVKIRKLVVEKIALRRDVLKCIVERTKDSDSSVALASYKRLEKLVNKIMINDRRNIFYSAVYGPHESVRTYFYSHFLQSCLNIFNDNILEMLKAFRFDSNETDLEDTLVIFEKILNQFYFKTNSMRVICNVLQLNDMYLIPYEELNYETVSYWRLLLELISDKPDMEPCNCQMPEAVIFVNYLKGFLELGLPQELDAYCEKQFIIEQLFHILKIYDLTEPFLTKTAHSIVENFLKNGTFLDGPIKTIVGILNPLFPDEDSKFRFGMEIVSDIINPLNVEEEAKKDEETRFQLAKLKVQLRELEMEQESAITSSDFLKANNLKEQIEIVSHQIVAHNNFVTTNQQTNLKKIDDMEVICKCLDIAFAFLQTAKIKKLTPSMISFKEDLLIDYLMYETEVVRLKALRCFAVCCIFDQVSARQGIHIFSVPILAYEAEEDCSIQILLVSIAAVADLLGIYGYDLIAKPTESPSDSIDEEHQRVFTGGTSLSAVLKGLVNLMDDEDEEIQMAACNGLCKLLLQNPAINPAIISRLILKWCNPTSEAPQVTIIGHALKVFAGLTGIEQHLEKAIIITIETLANAPDISPLANVDINDVVDLMLALCKMTRQNQIINYNLTMELCKIMRVSPEPSALLVYSKILFKFEVPDDKVVLQQISDIIEIIRERTSERSILNNLRKYLAILSQKLNENTTPPNPDPCSLSDISEDAEANNDE